MLHLLAALVLVFKVWLATDALRRREACYWPWIILLVPLGAIVYFFVIKLDDYSVAWIADWFRRLPSVQDLQFQFDQTPSFSNRVGLAGALYGEARYAEAAEHFMAALQQEPTDRESIYGLGLTRIAQGQFDEAATHLEALVDQDKSYRQYAAWQPLAHALFESGRRDDCLDALRRLVAENPRMDHKMLLARYLQRSGELHQARDLLQETLTEHDHSPRFLRRRNFRNALAARSMLKALDKPA